MRVDKLCALQANSLTPGSCSVRVHPMTSVMALIKLLTEGF